MEPLEYLKQCYQETHAPSLLIAIQVVEEYQRQIEELIDVLCAIYVQQTLMYYPYMESKYVH